MGYRTKIKHLSESNVKMASDGELLVSSTSGHLSVKGPRGVVSRTKDIEARLASINCVLETLQSILYTANMETVADLTHIKDVDNTIGKMLDDVTRRFSDLGMSYKDFKLDIDHKYSAVKEIDELLASVGIFERAQQRVTKDLRNQSDEHSTEIRDLEKLFIDKICCKLNNIQHYYFKHTIDMAYIQTTYNHIKEMIPKLEARATDQLKEYIEVEYDLFRDSNKGKGTPDIKLLNVYDDINMPDIGHMSYDDFVDASIGFIFSKHDIASYTPYKPANKK